MRRRESVDLSIYWRGFAVLAKNPVIFVFPLLAGVIEIGLKWISGPIFDPLGGNDFGFFGLILNIVNGFAFCLAIIAAETGWRGRKATFTGTMDEGSRKAGNIVLATIGFFFILYAAGMIGGFIHPLAALVLMPVAAFFMVYVFPAAAIGGIPGFNAISASIERVRGNYLGAAVLAVATIILYYYAAVQLLLYLPIGIYVIYAVSVAKALVLAYLAVVFARQYDDVGFFRPY